MNIIAQHPNVAEALVRYLVDLGVRHAFGVSGGAIAPLWAALSASEIGVAHFRHESGAAFAAIEAHLSTGEPVVVFTTTGPGLTNVLTGLLAARGEGAKIIVLSACTSAAQRGKWPIQETDGDTIPVGLATSGALFHMATTLESADALPQVVVRLANGLSRPGGFIAHLALPTELQATRTSTPAVTLPPVWGLPAEAPSESVVERCAALLADGPVAIWLGFGARGAAASNRELAEPLGAAVMCSPRAKGIFPEDHPLFVGVTGIGGHRSVLSYMERHRPSWIVVLGTRLGEPTSFWAQAMIPERGFIHVDVDQDVPGVAYPSVHTVPVRADAGAFVTSLLAKLPAGGAAWPPGLPRPTILAATETPGLVHPATLMQAIQRSVIDAYGSLVLAECGNALAWATHLLRFHKPGQYRVSTGVGAMGHCAAGVVGAAHATGRRAVAIVGDGAMLMNNEISTAVALRAPATWIVLNDARYNMCEQGMASLGLRADASIPPVNFAMLAHALGAAGAIADGDLDAALTSAMAADGPFVLDVRIDPAAIAPAMGRNRGLRAQVGVRETWFHTPHALATQMDIHDGI